MNKSYDILRQAIDKVGVKKIAARLGISRSLVYKWCQQPEDSSSLDFHSGAANPLDRLRIIYEETQDPQLVHWVCQLANGFLVNNPKDLSQEEEVRILGFVS